MAMNKVSSALGRLAIAALGILALLPGSASGAARTPVVLFPAFHFTKLLVTVRDQVVAPGCPRSGTFQDWFLNDHPSTRFSQVCEDKLLTLRYDRDGHEPMSQQVLESSAASRCGSSDYGKTQSAPFYEPHVRGARGGRVRAQHGHPGRRI